MGIIHIAGASVWGGGEQYVYDINAEMQRRGKDVYVLVDESNAVLCSRFAETAEIVPAKLYKGRGIASLFSTARFMKKRRIGLIACHSGKYVLTALLLKKLTGAKVLFFKHNAIAGKSDRYHRWIEKETDLFVCVSQLVYDLQMRGTDREKYVKVYNGIDAERFSHVLPRMYVQNYSNGRPFTIGYAGRIVENKGWKELVDAVVLLHEAGKFVRLLLVGGGSDTDIACLCDYIKKVKAQEYISYEGYARDMGDFYEKIDCFVLPSKVREAFGLVLCEALYCNVPVITSASGAQGEIITDKVTGRIVDPLDVCGLEEALTAYYENPLQAGETARRGKKNVKEKFLISRTVDELFAAIKNLGIEV